MASKIPKDKKAKRLAEQLRANLQRRKQQSRARRAGEGDSRVEGIKASSQLKSEIETDDN